MKKGLALLGNVQEHCGRTINFLKDADKSLKATFDLNRICSDRIMISRPRGMKFPRRQAKRKAGYQTGWVTFVAGLSKSK